MDPNENKDCRFPDDDVITFEEALALIKYPTGVPLPGTERYLKNNEDGGSSLFHANREQKEEVNKRNR